MPFFICNNTPILYWDSGLILQRTYGGIKELKQTVIFPSNTTMLFYSEMTKFFVLKDLIIL